jgi:spermidine synthase
MKAERYLIFLLIIFLEGFVSISVEIVTIRQLLPVAGGSVIVTSLVIGFFLLFLALGYHQGGKVIENPQKILRKNFFISAIWLGVGLSSAFIFLFFYSFQKMLGEHIVYPLVAYLLLIIAPLIYLLGQTIPAIGKISGNTLGLSTLGSFLGSIVTTLVLIYFLGVAWTVCVNSIFLFILFMLLVEDKVVLQLLLCVGISAAIYNLNVSYNKNQIFLADNYADYKIYASHDEKILSINNSASSSINSENKGFAYIERIKKILFTDMKLHDATILVLGAGGFTLSAANTYHNHFIYVDIDKKIKQVVVPHFLDHINGTFITDDARNYIRSTTMQYPAIVVDTFSNDRSIPSYLLTREYMREIKNKLTAHGVVIFNIIANPMLMDSYSKRIDNTIRSVFASCMAMPTTYADTINNILYVCANENHRADKTIYSDNLNTADTDYFAW